MCNIGPVVSIEFSVLCRGALRNYDHHTWSSSSSALLTSAHCTQNKPFRCVSSLHKFLSHFPSNSLGRMLQAVESSVNNGDSFSQIQSCFGEEELAVLPRHTKVVVTGNNRTKSVLVGLHGVVKKAVGLGGWHWLVLTNGIEVKLQRNALRVIEAPTGDEEDDDLDFESFQWNVSDMASDDTQKSQRSRHRVHKSCGSSHKTICRSFSIDSQSKGSVFTPQESASTKIDLGKLEMAALWRYWQHFNLVNDIPNPSKEQLIDVVQQHFMSQQIDELQVILEFVKAAKRMRNM